MYVCICLYATYSDIDMQVGGGSTMLTQYGFMAVDVMLVGYRVIGLKSDMVYF